MTIVNGEVTQLFGEDLEDPMQSYQDRIYAKTASLFEVATEGAALLSNCKPNLVEAMKHFGYVIGMAFQVVDDVLDFTGNPNDVGKPVGSDLRQGLITLPALFYLEDQSELRRTINQIHTGALSSKELDQLIIDIRESDAIARSLDHARHYINEAKAKLEFFPAAPEREALSDLADYIATRST